MSLDAARLDAIRQRLEAIGTEYPWEEQAITLPPGSDQPGADWEQVVEKFLWAARTDLADLLAAHEALTAERDEAMHAAFGGQALVDRLREEKEALAAQVAALSDLLIAKSSFSEKHLNRLALQEVLADTAAAAEAFKRQQQLEGARELADRFLSRPQTMADALADMERGDVQRDDDQLNG